MSSSQPQTENEAAGTASSETTSNPDRPAAPQPDQQLPPLSPADFRVYNRLADKMDMFHNHFRRTWTTLHTAATSNKRPPGRSIKSFIDEGLYFAQMLRAHHDIEETYLFPLLARKMPEFRAGKNAAELLRQHQEIHRGMDEFEAYLRACRSGETELAMSRLRELMDSWGTVLWTHLDQEVKTLGAENMRRYWTLDEVRQIPV